MTARWRTAAPAKARRDRAAKDFTRAISAIPTAISSTPSSWGERAGDGGFGVGSGYIVPPRNGEVAARRADGGVEASRHDAPSRPLHHRFAAVPPPVPGRNLNVRYRSKAAQINPANGLDG